jgi:hypothetical protein
MIFSSIVLLKINVFFLLKNVAKKFFSKIKKLVVLIPPPVPVGEAPKKH